MPHKFKLSRFYPIVPDAAWAARLIPLGVKTLQLRMKCEANDAIITAVAKSLAMAQRHDCQLIVNDYWQIAIDAGARFVHLGQEDLASADLKAIRRAGIIIGVSSHDEAEREAALIAGADYIALGPIYETKFKAMRFGPQGLDKVSEWKKAIGARPLVAIGGITLTRAPDVFAHGADSVAVITDFAASADPIARVEQWLAAVQGASE